MNEERTWIAKGISLNGRGQLVIDTEPCYGNRKKWEGEMLFELENGVMSQLTAIMDEFTERKRKAKLAEVELAEFREMMKSQFQQKRSSLAEQLDLDLDEIQKDLWIGD